MNEPNWRKIDDNTPRDQYILLYKKPRTNDAIFANKPLVVVGELIEQGGKTHHLWNGLYAATVEQWKQWISPRWNEKFTHWQPLGDEK